MTKVELLEKISPYEKGSIIEMREDLVKWIFKNKVKVLEKKKAVKKIVKTENKAVLKTKK